MSHKTGKKPPKRPKRPKVKWYNDWMKMPIALVLAAGASIALGAYCSRFAPGSTPYIVGALLIGFGGLCIIGTVGLAMWKLADEALLRRVTCPKCHARNKIPRRLTHYQCSACGKRSRV